jgi:hypothetical protein
MRCLLPSACRLTQQTRRFELSGLLSVSESEFIARNRKLDFFGSFPLLKAKDRGLLAGDTRLDEHCFTAGLKGVCAL